MCGHSFAVALLLLALGIDKSTQLDVCEGLVENSPLQFDMELTNRVVRRGDPLELVCAVYGAPQATITWYRNGVPVRNDEKEMGWAAGVSIAAVEGHEARRLGTGLIESRLTLPCVDARAAGLYSCRARSACTESIQSDAFVAVDPEQVPTKSICPRGKLTEKAAPRIVTSTNTRLEFAGNTVQLICRAVGRPTPQITWQRLDDDNKLVDIENDTQYMSRFQALPNGDLLVLGDDNTETTVSLRCTATNSVGSTHADSTIVYISPEE